MRKLLILLLLIQAFVLPVSAADFTAPDAPPEAEELMPAQVSSFGKDLWTVICAAVEKIAPSLSQGAGTCLCLIALELLMSLFSSFPGENQRILELTGSLAVGMILLQSMGTMIHLAADTVRQVSDYGKMLLPVMTAAMAAQGGTTSAAALYTGTAFFDSLLSSLIAGVLVPGVYVYLVLSVAHSAIGEELLKRLRDLCKWLMTWGLKIILYVFTGYMGITGVVSGSADAAALKVTKMTISGVVPVVGGILSDASEAVLVSAGVMKSAAGVYGILALCAIWILPFLRIGIQYLLLKATAAFCGVFGKSRHLDLIQDFSTAMGLLLAMTGSVTLLQLISTVCFMKGVA